MFVLDKSLLPSLKFVGKAVAYSRVEQLKSGRVLALPTNIGLDSKGLPGPNTPAYFENS